jgi:hypothetical protein
MVSKYMNELRKIHLNASKHIFQYLKGTQEGDSNVLSEFINFDWEGMWKGGNFNH